MSCQHRKCNCGHGAVAHTSTGDEEEVSKPYVPPVPQARISTAGLEDDAEARRLIRRALRDAAPPAERFGWRLATVCELDPDDEDVGYTSEDGTVFVKVRDPAMGGSHTGSRGRCFYPYGFVLATLLHELVHLSHLGHGKTFYKCLAAAVSLCGAELRVRREAHGYVCAELLNAVCDNDARRARALLTVLPEAVTCQRPGVSQTPLEYAAHHGRVAMTRLLLEARADPLGAEAGGAGQHRGISRCSEEGSSMPPLARAAARGNAKTMALLLSARADATAVDPAGQAVLEKAIAAAEASASSEASNGGQGGLVGVLSKAKGHRKDCGCSTGSGVNHTHGSHGVRQRKRAKAALNVPSRRAFSLPALPAAWPCDDASGNKRALKPAGPERRRVTLSGSLAV
mmetsp:Transcript_139670/g.243137  ORF Transcript_139670/g.243137 Transcript_139670/m.243137 type:complete len:399 (-) Transcript_139670:81-1277(-)